MTFDSIIRLTDMMGVPKILFTLKLEGVTKLLRALHMTHPIFLTDVSVYVSGMCLGNFKFFYYKWEVVLESFYFNLELMIPVDKGKLHKKKKKKKQALI